jgi:hypothetical protein
MRVPSCIFWANLTAFSLKSGVRRFVFASSNHVFGRYWREGATLSASGKPISEKDATLAQKLGQLQPFVAVSPQECTGQPAFSGPT